ncbi:hypothetical protein TU84_06040 [Pseudomonas helleri]|nr:hypothetical protein TU84_06040 [Pseudomonas helleri]
MLYWVWLCLRVCLITRVTAFIALMFIRCQHLITTVFTDLITSTRTLTTPRRHTTGAQDLGITMVMGEGTAEAGEVDKTQST